MRENDKSLAALSGEEVDDLVQYLIEDPYALQKSLDKVRSAFNWIVSLIGRCLSVYAWECGQGFLTAKARLVSSEIIFVYGHAMQFIHVLTVCAVFTREVDGQCGQMRGRRGKAQALISIFRRRLILAHTLYLRLLSCRGLAYAISTPEQSCQIFP